MSSSDGNEKFGEILGKILRGALTIVIIIFAGKKGYDNYTKNKSM